MLWRFVVHFKIWRLWAELYFGEEGGKLTFLKLLYGGWIEGGVPWIGRLVVEGGRGGGRGLRFAIFPRLATLLLGQIHRRRGWPQV